MRIGYLFIFLSLALAGCSNGVPGSDASAPPAAPADSVKNGNDIIAEYLRRDAAPIRKNRVRFTITAEDEPVEVYEIDTTRKQTDAETVTLTQFIKPAEDSDLASLTVEAKGKPTVVTTYVASRGEFRETDSNKSFFGGLTAGELLGEWTKYDFRYLGEKEGLFDLEAKLKASASGVVAIMKVRVRADNYVPVEIELFDRTERHIRTYKVRDVKTDAKGSYAARTEVENHIYLTKIVIEVLNREFPESVDDPMFTREKLTQIAGKRK